VAWSPIGGRTFQPHRINVVKPHPRFAVWGTVRALPEFRRLLELRAVSSFGDGLFQGGLVGALLFDPERATSPWEIAGQFAALYLPYSLLGPFAGALLDRWDRRGVLIGANLARLLLMSSVALLVGLRASAVAILLGALVINGFTRFVSSGLSAALPHVVPRDQVVAMNSVANAVSASALFVGAIFMLVPRWVFGAGHVGSATAIFLAAAPVGIAWLLSKRFAPHVLGPDDTMRAVHGSVVYAVATGWGYGVRTVLGVKSVASTLSGVVAHRVVFGINTLVILVLVRHSGSANVGGLGVAVLFGASAGTGAFLANFLTPATVRRWGRYATVNVALAAAAAIQLGGAGLKLPIMLACGFLLGAAGQVVKLCGDSAMQLDVDDALRGHVFTVQDSLFWVGFVAAITVSAAVIPTDGHSPALVIAGSAVYLVGLAAHAAIGRGARQPD
jgi:MFS family permease